MQNAIKNICSCCYRKIHQRKWHNRKSIRFKRTKEKCFQTKHARTYSVWNAPHQRQRMNLSSAKMDKKEEFQWKLIHIGTQNSDKKCMNYRDGMGARQRFELDSLLIDFAADATMHTRHSIDNAKYVGQWHIDLPAGETGNYVLYISSNGRFECDTVWSPNCENWRSFCEWCRPVTAYIAVVERVHSLACNYNLWSSITDREWPAYSQRTYIFTQCALGCVSVAAMATKAMQMVDAMLVTFILNWDITQEYKVPNGSSRSACNASERVRAPH